MIGNADFPQDLYLARGADRVREPETDEAAEVNWIPLTDAAMMIFAGQIAGAASVIAVQHALMLQADASCRPCRPARRPLALQGMRVVRGGMPVGFHHAALGQQRRKPCMIVIRSSVA